MLPPALPFEPLLPLLPIPDDPLEDEPLPELLPLEPGLVELPEPLGLLGLELGEEGLLDEEPDPLEPAEPALSR